MGPRKRILFFAEGATMAHFVRPVALADSLVADGDYELYLYAPARFEHDLATKPYHTGELKTASPKDFMANIARGKPMFSADTLRGYVADDRHLIRSLQPDLVVGDMRLSLSISTRLERVPYAAIMNAYWSPYAKRRSVIPELPLTHVIPPRLLGPIYRFAEPLAFALHVAQMNRVREEFGIAPLPLDLRKMYTDGNYVLYPDIPEFVPTDGAPPNHCYVGTCNWVPSTPKPDWWESMRLDPKPKVLVSLGSSGPIQVLPNLLAALARLPVSIVLTTSGRPVPPLETKIYIADLLPLIETAACAAIIVSQGASGAVYAAMTAGKPMLAIPSNADQQLCTAILEENGAGLGVRVEDASSKTLHSAVQRILSTTAFTTSARGWSILFRKDQQRNRFREFLGRVMRPTYGI